MQIHNAFLFMFSQPLNEISAILVLCCHSHLVDCTTLILIRLGMYRCTFLLFRISGQAHQPHCKKVIMKLIEDLKVQVIPTDKLLICYMYA